MHHRPIKILTKTAELRAPVSPPPFAKYVELFQEILPNAETVCIDRMNYDLAGADVFNVGDHVFLTNEARAYLATQCEKCHRVIHVMDDYKSRIPSQMVSAILDKPNVALTTVPELKKPRWVKEVIYYNFNRWRYNPLPIVEPTINKILFYGTKRPGRVKTFEKFLGPGAEKHVVVSCSVGNMMWFDQFNPDLVYINRIRIPHDIQKYSLSLYLVDGMPLYEGPSNRFYESLSAGVGMIFSPNCKTNFPDLEIEPFIVQGPQDYAEFLGRSAEIRAAQLAWRSDTIITDRVNQLVEVLQCVLQS